MSQLEIFANSVAECTFCKIARGDIEVPLVYEDNAVIAFLDHRPLFLGHCLLIPKEHFETVGDLDTRLIAPVFSGVKLLSKAIELGTGAEGTFVAINNRVSQSVPHLHVHIVPRKKKDGLKGFFWPRQKFEADATTHIQEAIRSAVELIKSEHGLSL